VGRGRHFRQGVSVGVLRSSMAQVGWWFCLLYSEVGGPACGIFGTGRPIGRRNFGVISISPSCLYLIFKIDVGFKITIKFMMSYY
jgi:hypothetical protein